MLTVKHSTRITKAQVSPGRLRRGGDPAAPRSALALLILAAFAGQAGGAWAQSLREVLSHARPTTAPTGRLSPRTDVHPLATAHPGAAWTQRRGVVQLSNGRILRGRIWTTPDRPFRVWLAGIKQYRDIPMSLVQTIQVQVRSARMIRQWRWRQEGSDIKLYSGKTKPRFRYAYQFTLIRGQPITGTLEAPLFVQVGARRYNLILYKHLEGHWGQKLAAVVYVRQVWLAVTPQLRKAAAELSRRLPLLSWRKMLAGVKLPAYGFNPAIP